MPITTATLKNYKNCFIFNDKNILVTKQNNLPSYELFTKIKENIKYKNLLAENEYNFIALEIDNNIIEDSFNIKNLFTKIQEIKEIPIREYFSYKSKTEVSLCSRAKSLLNWDNSTNFCSTCGTKLIYSSIFTAKQCPNCKKEIFPQIEPCVIVLVKDKEKFLLAKHVQRNQDIYTCIAGFIEAGETAEQAVIREVKEETGLNIKNIQYKGSQGWPYPDQLMLAFTAEYESGRISIQKEELKEAKWFTKETLPQISLPGSVAYKLIFDLFN